MDFCTKNIYFCTVPETDEQGIFLRFEIHFSPFIPTKERNKGKKSCALQGVLSNAWKRESAKHGISVKF